jgi:hypothetical protein
MDVLCIEERRGEEERGAKREERERQCKLAYYSWGWGLAVSA